MGTVVGISRMIARIATPNAEVSSAATTRIEVITNVEPVRRVAACAGGRSRRTITRKYACVARLIVHGVDVPPARVRGSQACAYTLSDPSAPFRLWEQTSSTRVTDIRRGITALANQHDLEP